MFYWYSDPSQKSHDVRGMVQAAASILYPAFKENVEAILPWTGIMKRGIVFEGLLRFMDQQRRNNFYFFENCSAIASGGASAFIPFENLGTLELAGMTGNVGKEIYGAGESLWMYLMFEALGQVSDRELMLVNLDLLDAARCKRVSATKVEFHFLQPHSQRPIRETIEIPPAKGRPVRVSVNGKASTAAVTVPKQSFMQLYGRVLTGVASVNWPTALLAIAERRLECFSGELKEGSSVMIKVHLFCTPRS